MAPYRPQKARFNVLLAVGLQGSGKTTTCCKLAGYYARKGWKVGLICADTFRAGAFDQLRQNAARVKVPFYGSTSTTDPVTVVREGLDRFKRESFELVIVDTSGRHKQEIALFEEMQQIAAVAHPDNVIFVMDGSIGQAADIQARAFRQAIPIGSVIITKLDGHARGGGALSAVAATGAPILFIGTGEHMTDLEAFAVRPFINKMLGLGDIRGLVETVRDLRLEERQDLMKNLEAGIFTLRDMYEQLGIIMQMGPVSKVMSMMPGFSSDMFQQGTDAEMAARLRRCMTIMDSMTRIELDSDGKPFQVQPSRIRRVAQGSGNNLEDVETLLLQHKKFAQMVKKMGGNNGLFKALSGGGSSNPRGTTAARLNQQLSTMLPPGMLQQMGGVAGVQDMMRQMQIEMGSEHEPNGMVNTKTRGLGGAGGRKSRR